MNGWQIVAGSIVAYALCAIALVVVIDGHHPLTHLAELLHRLGGR
ncbi:hypothetical protein ABZ741_04595 [Streptomyces globisporus]